PARPPPPATAGPAGVGAVDPAHYDVAGVAARCCGADAVGPATAVGADLGTVVVDVSNFWIAADPTLPPS
ncbi:MAG: hypothetical protein ABIJ48_04695, partial [Actinomycetota bacterium]